ncbi:MAG: S8 family peptidase [Vicinamibacterales bacterium]
MTIKQTALVLTIVATSALGIRGASEQKRAHLSDDLAGHVARHTSARTRVIVHGNAAALASLITKHHVQILRTLEDGAVISANSAEVDDIAGDSAFDHLSGDPLVKVGMSVSNQATAADQVRGGVAGGLLGIGAIPGVTGQGIGVAIVDSGISPHPALTNKVVANVSLITGDASVLDAFGHGTHVAGIIAGNATASRSVTTLFNGGVAPGVQLVNVRVLGADGVGRTSDVIAGIQWAIANRARYNIRIINLSLGHPVMEPAATDPLCEVVASAVQAGIVVVAAAGNDGIAPNGSRILGGINSPGNSPWAITVGSINTWGTAKRSDDTLTTYSSHGPTRFDGAVKPDVAAPGNKIVSLEASGSYIPRAYSYLHRAGSGPNSYMQLSGTSMSAPMVSGGAALLLQGSPRMGPSQVKMALQAGATYMPDAGFMGAGAGSVNFMASRKLTTTLLGLIPSNLIAGLLSPSSGAIFWDTGTMASRLYAGKGIRLLSILQAPLAWLNAALLNIGDLNLLGLNNPLASVVPKWLLYGEVAGWTGGQSIMWGDAIYDPQGQSIMWGDSYMTDGTSIMWGDSVMAADPQ